MGTLVVASEANETRHVYLSYHSLRLAGCFSTACIHVYISVWHNNPFMFMLRYYTIIQSF
jgi:hypothetical protein